MWENTGFPAQFPLEPSDYGCPLPCEITVFKMDCEEEIDTHGIKHMAGAFAHDPKELEVGTPVNRQFDLLMPSIGIQDASLPFRPIIFYRCMCLRWQ